MDQRPNVDMGIFQRAALVAVETGVWTVARRIKEKLIDSAAKPERLKAEKFLIDKDAESYRKIVALRNAAHAIVRKYAVPWSLEGIHLIAHVAVAQVEAELASLRGRFEAAVEEFYAEYAEHISVARADLAELFDESDYPEDPRERFYIRWTFFGMAPVDGSLAQVSPDLYARESARLSEKFAEAREMACAALRKELAAMIDDTVERLRPDPVTGERKKFKDTVLTNLREWFDLFGQRNVWGDAELAALVERAQGVLGGTTPDRLRNDEALRGRLSSAIAQVGAVVQGGIVNARAGARKIMVAQRATEAATA